MDYLQLRGFPSCALCLRQSVMLPFGYAYHQHSSTMPCGKHSLLRLHYAYHIHSVPIYIVSTSLLGITFITSIDCQYTGCISVLCFSCSMHIGDFLIQYTVSTNLCYVSLALCILLTSNSLIHCTVSTHLCDVTLALCI